MRYHAATACTVAPVAAVQCQLRHMGVKFGCNFLSAASLTNRPQPKVIITIAIIKLKLSRPQVVKPKLRLN